jgi:hypothetical protein
VVVDHVVKTYLFDSDTVVLWALGLGGVALIIFELLHREGDQRLSAPAGGISGYRLDLRVSIMTRRALTGRFRMASEL